VLFFRTGFCAGGVCVIFVCVGLLCAGVFVCEGNLRAQGLKEKTAMESNGECKDGYCQKQTAGKGGVLSANSALRRWGRRSSEERVRLKCSAGFSEFAGNGLTFFSA